MACSSIGLPSRCRTTSNSHCPRLTWALRTSGLSQSETTLRKDPANPEVTRADSHYLTKAPDDKVTIVEFLDFECKPTRPSSRRWSESARSTTAGSTSAIRYFPLGGHQNGMNAALAVEAASKQGSPRDMYIKM